MAPLGRAPARRNRPGRCAARHPRAADLRARPGPAAHGGAGLRHRLVRPERAAGAPRGPRLRAGLDRLHGRVDRAGARADAAPERRGGAAAPGPVDRAGRRQRRAGAALDAAQRRRHRARPAVAGRRHAAAARPLRRGALLRRPACARVPAADRPADPQPVAQGEPARAHQPRLLSRRGGHHAGCDRADRTGLRRAPGLVGQPPADDRMAA